MRTTTREELYASDKIFTLCPGGMTREIGAPKFQGLPSTQPLLVDSPDPEPAEEPRFPEELLVRPELLFYITVVMYCTGQV